MYQNGGINIKIWGSILVIIKNEEIVNPMYFHNAIIGIQNSRTNYILLYDLIC